MTTSTNAVTELKILCGGALREILRELGDPYVRTSGIKLLAEFATSAAVRDRIRSGELFDVVITTQPAIEELSSESKLMADSAAIVARSGIGVAVRAGRPKPDIFSVETFVAALRSARSIAYADPAFGTPSGIYLAELFERLGVAVELKPKARLVGAAGGNPIVVCDVVASGEADLGIQQISEIVPVAGVDLVGPLPPEIQHITVFGVAVASAAKNPGPARDFVSFLTSEGAKTAIAANGMEPA
jgi:molybdate transport system substrate-binding protein